MKNVSFFYEKCHTIMSCLENATNYLSREWSGAYLTRVEYESQLPCEKFHIRQLQ